MKIKKLIITLLIAVVAIAMMPVAGTANVNKQYRNGEFAKINGIDYLITSNQEFVEILQVTSDDKLVQISEVHGMKTVLDTCISYEDGETFLVAVTGQYLMKYDINNPVRPEVVLQRDLYQWRNGKRKIGYMTIVECGDDYVYTAGSRGIRRFGKNNLQVDDNIKYTYERAKDIVVSKDKLAAIIGEEGTKGVVFDKNTGNTVGEYTLENIDGNRRKPALDKYGNVYFPVDNALSRGSFSFETARYTNPVEGTVNSYAVDAGVSNYIYYVNGYGLTKLNYDLNKVDFLFLANAYDYGVDSWSVNVSATDMDNGRRIAVFNKSSIILLDDDLTVLSQYKYNPRYSMSYGVSTDLGIKSSRGFAIADHDTVDVEVFGYWPNEIVRVSLGDYNKQIQVNNIGYGKIALRVPDIKKGITSIHAVGESSKLETGISIDIR